MRSMITLKENGGKQNPYIISNSCSTFHAGPEYKVWIIAVTVSVSILVIVIATMVVLIIVTQVRWAGLSKSSSEESSETSLKLSEPATITTTRVKKLQSVC